MHTLYVPGVASASGTKHAPEPEQTRLIRCNCAEDEDDRPKGIPGGCGRYWLARITLVSDGTYSISLEPDLGLLPAAQLLDSALSNQSTNVKGAAEKWLAGVAALVGLYSIAGVTIDHDVLAGLSLNSRLIIASTFMLSVLAAGISLIRGYSAAYGWPVPESISTDTLRNWHENTHQYGLRAARSLRAAVCFAFLTLLLMSTSVVLVWILQR